MFVLIVIHSVYEKNYSFTCSKGVNDFDHCNEYDKILIIQFNYS